MVNSVTHHRQTSNLFECSIVLYCLTCSLFLVLRSCLPYTAEDDGMISGGFFLAWEDFWRMFTNSVPACTFFPLQVEISLCKPTSPFRPGSVHRLSELKWLWLSITWHVVCGLFSWQIPTLCLDSSVVSPLQLWWVRGVCVFRCNLPPALLAEWLGSFTCHCGNMGVEQTPYKSQHTKLTLEKKIPHRVTQRDPFCDMSTEWQNWHVTHQAV